MGHGINSEETDFVRVQKNNNIWGDYIWLKSCGKWNKRLHYPVWYTWISLLCWGGGWKKETRNCFPVVFLKVHHAHHHANTHACEGVFIPPESKCHFSKHPLLPTYIQVLRCSLWRSFYITLCTWLRLTAIISGGTYWTLKEIYSTLSFYYKEGKGQKVWDRTQYNQSPW